MTSAPHPDGFGGHPGVLGDCPPGGLAPTAYPPPRLIHGFGPKKEKVASIYPILQGAAFLATKCRDYILQ